MSEVESTCPYCGVGCGLSVKIDDDNHSKPPLVLASNSHPANLGRLCSKGSALAQTITNDDKRLVSPVISGKQSTWDEASTVIAQRIQSSIAEHGKESVAFYLSGQLLTEDYYVANKLMKGFIGTANVDTNSRLCMSSAVAAYKRAFGADAVPGCYEDLDVADLIILIGSNAAWTHPVLYQRMQSAKQQNSKLKIVLVDPRKTVSCDIADLHLQLDPSSDGFLFQGLLNFLVENDYLNQAYIDKYTEGFVDAKTAAVDYGTHEVSTRTSLSEAKINEFYELFANTDKVVSFYSQGINQSATGTDKCNAIINCHLATGKIGYAGAGPFSITGQPNAMGGREVGGLANMLAAHMDFTDEDTARVQRFWNSPSIAGKPGLKAVDMFDAVHNGEIKVLWIMATNPAVSLPDSNFIRAALQKCETVIVSDVTQTDTTQYADILLPALAWGEKDGTVTNSERCISRQRSFLENPSLAKPDWWAVTQVANKMGFGEQFNYQGSYDVFVEHAALSGFENTEEHRRCFDISALSGLDQAAYDSLTPMQWPINSIAPNGSKRLFTDGQFYTSSRKAQFVSAPAKHAQALLGLHSQNPQAQDRFFLLNTGRLRDQWHTMTRTGNASSLTSHDELPFVQIHADDALLYKIEQGDFIKLNNKLGGAILRADISSAVNRGQLFVPIHWNDQFSTLGVINSLIEQLTDPVSGQPESKAGRVNVKKFEAAYWAKIISSQPIDRQSQFTYWSTSKVDGGYVTLVAADEAIKIDELIFTLQLDSDEQSQGLSSSLYSNPITGFQSGILSEFGNTSALYFCAKSLSELPGSVWLIDALVNSLNARLGTTLRGEQGHVDTLVCACFGTSRKTIAQACKQQEMSQAMLGERLGCGSKCGSCIPEINLLLSELETSQRFK